MPDLIFEGKGYERLPDETVLECLMRYDVQVPHSCKNGICQSCLMRAVKADPPAESQKGIRKSLQDQRYFLACCCSPQGDFEATLRAPELIRLPARVLAVDKLSPRIVRVRLDPAERIDYRPGQFLNLFRSDGLVRSYSIASIPQTEEFLELHVARIDGGRMSNWIHYDLQTDANLEISAPLGDCYYQPGIPGQPLLLIGTGCGLAPLYGIVRDALYKGHEGPIWVYHGSRDRDGLYMVDELRDLARDFSNFNYQPCLSGEDEMEGISCGRVNDVVFKRHTSLKHWRVFLCGHPDMVTQSKKKAFLAGATLSDIHADPFHITPRVDVHSSCSTR